MNFLNKSCKFYVLLTFSISAVFGIEDETIILPAGEKEQKNSEYLEEEVMPSYPAELITLDQDRKKTKQPKKYGSLALFLFNVAMFTAGITIVKVINGKNVY